MVTLQRAIGRVRTVAPSQVRDELVIAAIDHLRVGMPELPGHPAGRFASLDQEQTRRMTERQQPGACLQCHASNLSPYRFAGKGDVMKDFAAVSATPFHGARAMMDDNGQALVQHSVACVDCHEPKTMALRVTRPGIINGIKALRSQQGVPDYHPNRDVSRQEMRRSSAAVPRSSTTSGGRARS